MTVADLDKAMAQIAPPELAQDWDNVGLLVGDPAAALGRIGLCIDLTPAVLAEAVDAGCGAVVAYHPPIFKPVKRLTGGVVFDAIRAGVAIYSPHTALDVAEGGTNDVLAEAVGVGPDRRPLEAAADGPWAKLVTFVPRADAGAVADALFAAGCGSFGDYSRCSVRHDVTGTFRPGDAANPAVGQRGRDEHVDETRLEVIVPPGREADAVAALRQSHPYEEPAFDLFPRLPTPRGGLGRVGPLSEPTTRRAFVERVKQKLDLPHVLVAGPIDGDAARAAVCAGSCGGDLLHAAADAGVDVYVTGELRHHDALLAAKRGLTIVCTLHSHSERPTLAVVAGRLRAMLPGLTTHLCAADRDPFAYA